MSDGPRQYSKSDLRRFRQTTWEENVNFPIKQLKTGGCLKIRKAFQHAKLNNTDAENLIKEAETRFSDGAKYELNFDEYAALYLYTKEAGEESLYLKVKEALGTSDKALREMWLRFLQILNSELNKARDFQGTCYQTDSYKEPWIGTCLPETHIMDNVGKKVNGQQNTAGDKGHERRESGSNQFGNPQQQQPSSTPPRNDHHKNDATGDVKQPASQNDGNNSNQTTQAINQSASEKKHVGASSVDNHDAKDSTASGKSGSTNDSEAPPNTGQDKGAGSTSHRHSDTRTGSAQAKQSNDKKADADRIKSPKNDPTASTNAASPRKSQASGASSGDNHSDGASTASENSRPTNDSGAPPNTGQDKGAGSTSHRHSDPVENLINRLTDVDYENIRLQPIDLDPKGRTIEFEVAVERLIRTIKGLGECKELVKQYAKINSDNKLNQDESRAIFLYTAHFSNGDFSRTLNKALRSQDRSNFQNHWFLYVQLLWSAINKLDSVRGYYHQSGASKLKEIYKKGSFVTWWGFTSCTHTFDNAIASFDETPVVLRIKVLKGKDISMYSSTHKKTEIVLLPGTELRVTDTWRHKEFPIDIIDLEEVYDGTSNDQSANLTTKKAIKKDKSIEFGLPPPKHPLCQYESDKSWLDCRFKDEQCSAILKPKQLEPYLGGPPKIEDQESLNRIKGSMFGLILGDALGAHVEFRPRGYMLAHPVTDLQAGGTWGLEKGQFTDDGSMALCLANSLVARHGFVSYDQLVRYKWWFRYGYMSSTGNCFDIGEGTRKAILEFEKRQVEFARKNRIPVEEIDFLSDEECLRRFRFDCSAPGAAGNGSLMRLAPVPLFFYRKPAEAVRNSGWSSVVTHGDKKAVDACRYYGALIVAAMMGISKEEFLKPDFYPSKLSTWFSDKPLDEAVEHVAKGSFRKKDGYDDGIRGKGFVVNSLEAALWAFHATNSFEEGALAAVNLGDDTDTTAAIYGQLAGAYYGYDQLPPKWLSEVYAHQYINCLSHWIAYEGEQHHRKQK